MTGAEVLAIVLRRWGCTTVFAYAGTSELALCAAVDRSDGLMLVNSRGDKEAAFMAAGGNLWGQAACVAVLHGARGLTNALGAVADVRRSEVPVLYLVGMPLRPSAGYLPPGGEPGLIDCAGCFATAAFDCSVVESFDAAAFVKVVSDAVRAVDQTPLGPVLLGVPQDLLSAPFVPRDMVAEAFPETPPRSEPDITEVLNLISSAARPVILVDDYLLRSSTAESALAAFATQLAAPVLQVSYRRGPMLFQQLRVESVPTYVGQYDATSKRHRGIVGSADLLITVEDRNMYPRVVGHLPACRKLAITSNVGATAKNGYLRSSDTLLAGDVCRIMRRIAEHLAGRRPEGLDCHPFEGLSGRARMPGQEDAVCCGSAVELVRAIARGMDAASRPAVVDDSQMLGGLVARNYHVLPRPLRVFGSHGGFVGGGLATAAGLAVAHPGLSVVALLGDQGFTNAVQALAAVGERRAPLLVVVCNNGASVSLQQQADFDGVGAAGHAGLGNAPQMSYTAIARGFGLTATELVWPDDTHCSDAVTAASLALTGEIRHAIAARRPHLIELVTPGRPTFWTGVWRSTGVEDFVPEPP